jgi:hypothetical protein
MNAVYKLRTALYDVMPTSERSEAYKQARARGGAHEPFAAS